MESHGETFKIIIIIIIITTVTDMISKKEKGVIFSLNRYPIMQIISLHTKKKNKNAISINKMVIFLCTSIKEGDEITIVYPKSQKLSLQK